MVITGSRKYEELETRKKSPKNNQKGKKPKNNQTKPNTIKKTKQKPPQQNTETQKLGEMNYRRLAQQFPGRKTDLNQADFSLAVLCLSHFPSGLDEVSGL